MTARQLVTARERLGLSQAALAKALDVDVGTVSRWERGLRPIPRVVDLALRYLLAVAEA